MFYCYWVQSDLKIRIKCNMCVFECDLSKILKIKIKLILKIIINHNKFVDFLLNFLM